MVSGVTTQSNAIQVYIGFAFFPNLTRALVESRDWSGRTNVSVMGHVIATVPGLRDCSYSTRNEPKVSTLLKSIPPKNHPTELRQI